MTNTVLDGTVVRWFPDLNSAQIQRPWICASHHGVRVGPSVYLTEIPDDVVDAARAAWRELTSGRGGDLAYLATHRSRTVPNGPLIPVEDTDG
ncbi:hypothetical protein [Actinosynnema sp. NPDC023587]|uniref:hypothetical protein n=1 Tax=Actinosynnema sp. NPDC023587 TaxID=3154695 RepID=UPI0033F98B94